MNIYHTIEEKYLHALDKLSYGRTKKALKLLTEIIINEPLFARAHYQLGKLYYYELDDYQAAGYHFKTCMEIEPTFPDNYFHYLNLVVFLNMPKMTAKVAEQALKTPGVDIADIYNLIALAAEKRKDWKNALSTYNNAFDAVTNKVLKEKIESSIERVNEKLTRKLALQYHLSG